MTTTDQTTPDPRPDLRVVGPDGDPLGRYLTAVGAGTFDEVRADEYGCVCGLVDGPHTHADPSPDNPVGIVRPPVEQAETVADLAGTYCRMADELAAMVEAEATRSAAATRVLSNALGELHTALDELAARLLRGEL
jgi:hypothetical protein